MASEAPNIKEGMELVDGAESVIPFAPENGKTENIFQRLWTASNLIGQIEKDGQVKGGGNYKYVSHDNVTARAKEVFAKVGIYHCASMVDLKQDGNRTIAKVELHFINTDNVGDMVKTTSFGYGNDTQDKGPGKAYSYAVKYGLMKALMLNTDEDIEAHQIDHDSGVSEAVIKANSETKKALEAWAKTFKSAIENAPNLEALNLLEKENKSRLSSSDLPDVTRTFFIELITSRKSEVGT